MNAREFLKNNVVILDGGMGTLLQSAGLRGGESPERWNISHPEIVMGIHKEYFNAGSNIVNTNTFGANVLKFSHDELFEIISAAVANAKKARDESLGSQPKFIALDIGPTGKLLSPLGDLDFDDAVRVFAETVKIGVGCGVDLVTVETMSDSYETKAALLAVKENCDLPVIVTNAYGSGGRLMTGATPEAMVAMLEGMGADAIGLNCSLGPKQLFGVVEKLLACASVPVVVKPNAGLPVSVNGKTTYDVEAEEFAQIVSDMLTRGVRVVGGCCGTTPEYIRALAKLAANTPPVPLVEKNTSVVSSRMTTLTLGDTPVLIGGRIDLAKNEDVAEMLVNGEIDDIVEEGFEQVDKDVHMLGIIADIPDNKEVLATTVTELQSVISLPFYLKTSNILALETAMRRYNGKPMIGAVNGSKNSMKEVLPLVKKYGGVVAVPTTDENGAPSTAEEKIRIAKSILETAFEYGLNAKDVIFDPIAMTDKADESTLETIRVLHGMGFNTLADVSCMNQAFFAQALKNGLSAVLIDPLCEDMMEVYEANSL